MKRKKTQLFSLTRPVLYEWDEVVRIGLVRGPPRAHLDGQRDVENRRHANDDVAQAPLLEHHLFVTFRSGEHRQ